MLRDRRGFSMMWWASFFALVFIPVVVLGMGVSRFAIAAAEVQEAADLAALAASRDVLVRVWESSHYVQFADQVPYWRAEQYANLNTDYLDQHGIHVHVMAIDIDEAHDTIVVRVAADLEPLFPTFGLPLDYTIEREGEVQVWMRAIH